MSRSSGSGGVLGGIVVMLFLGFFVISLIARYWFFMLMGIGGLVLVYAHFLGSQWGGQRFKWRDRFGWFGAALWLIGALGMAAADPTLDAEGQTTLVIGMVVLLGLVHAASVLLRWLADMLHEFIHEGSIKREAAHERARRAQRERRKQKYQQHGHHEQARSRPDQEFQGTLTSEKHALELFELTKPFTQEQLSKRKIELLKKVHPDMGGSNMMARLVNEAYDVLKSRASQ